jgi:sulfur transfer complex TusBCD TusB component (DsrH family)
VVIFDEQHWSRSISGNIDTTALRDDAAERGWHTEVARHSRVIASIERHLTRLTRHAQRTADA